LRETGAAAVVWKGLLRGLREGTRKKDHDSACAPGLSRLEMLRAKSRRREKMTHAVGKNSHNKKKEIECKRRKGTTGGARSSISQGRAGKKQGRWKKKKNGEMNLKKDVGKAVGSPARTLSKGPEALALTTNDEKT